MPPKRSSFALVPSPLPPALPTFASLMLHFLFVMLPCILVISYVMIYLIRKANLMLYTFSAADPVVKSRLLQSYCLN